MYVGGNVVTLVHSRERILLHLGTADSVWVCSVAECVSTDHSLAC